MPENFSWPTRLKFMVLYLPKRDEFMLRTVLALPKDSKIGLEEMILSWILPRRCFGGRLRRRASTGSSGP